MKNKHFTLQKRFRTRNIVGAFLFCVGLIVLFHTKLISNSVLSEIRASASQVLAYLDVVSEVGSRFWIRVGSLFSGEINDTLISIQEENAQLRYENSALRHLETENTNLKKLLDIKEESKLNVATAKVITIFADDFSRSCLINAGKNKNISVDDIVFNSEGLIGRVIETGDMWSKVLLITDVGANVPVKIGEKNVNAIASGDNGDKLKIAIVHEDISLEVKQSVVTSGYGGVFDEDIKVGEIVEEGDKFFVRPCVDFNSLKYVNVLRKHAVD